MLLTQTGRFRASGGLSGSTSRLARGPVHGDDLGTLYSSWPSWLHMVGKSPVPISRQGLTHGVEASTAIPADVKTRATTQLSAGVPFISDSDLQAQLQKANLPPEVADPIVRANQDARLDALRTSLFVVVLFAVVGLFCTGMVPGEPIGGEPAARPRTSQRQERARAKMTGARATAPSRGEE